MTVYARWRGKLASRRALLATAERRVRYWRGRKAKAKATTVAYSHAGAMLTQREGELTKRRAQVVEAERVVARHKPVTLAVKAHRVAEGLLGTMEVGGNNRGARVSAIIRANGGVGPEAWCGDFVAYCYRLAGSTRVQRMWASVAALRGLLGIRATSSPTMGDLVRFTFDHVGMFEAWCDAQGRTVPKAEATHVRTIEGNTGASGAVSDSATGGDGVYRKIRHRSLVRDFLHVIG